MKCVKMVCLKPFWSSGHLYTKPPPLGGTRSSADADSLRDAFRGQSTSTNMVPFWVRCDFSLCMWPAPRVTTV